MIDYGFGALLGPLDRFNNQTYRSWRNSPEVYKWCRQHDLITDYAQEKWFEKQANDQSIKMFTILSHERDFIVGVCGLTSIDHINRRAEFSLYVAPNEQGKGYGKAGLKTLVSWGFKSLNLNLIWGETFEGNPAYKVFEEIGFKKEGTRRQFYFKDGKYIDAHLYSVLRDEWKL